MQHHFAEVNGIRMHYVTAGDLSKASRLILFAHGFPEFWYEWRRQLDEFGRDHLAVAPDLRGYNLTSKPEALEEYRMKYLIGDLRALAEHLGSRQVKPPGQFTLVAHDWGGAVAWAFAIAHPELLEKLIIINAPHPGVFARLLHSNPDQQSASQYMRMFSTREAEEILSRNHYQALDEVLLKPGLERGYFDEADRQAYLDAWSQPGALTGGLNYYRAARLMPPPPGTPLPETPLELDIASLTIHVPVLVIWGERDRALLTANLDGLDQFVPRLTIRRIPDADHWVVHQKPELVNRYIREFLQS
ncbi:MAG TPA: alpha/beta hydrolase [Bryobacteraceae bacterium]|nr:alpha/beta hydrolase [Bryobacteraceae bacterium]